MPKKLQKLWKNWFWRGRTTLKRAKSSREIRRQKQRQDRNTLAEIRLTPQEELRLKFFRNGITEKDVQKAYEEGLKEGRKFAEDFAFHTIYAAFIITMIDKHGMDADEAVDLLIEMDHQVVVCVEDSELADEAYEKTGVELHWDDAIGRIERKG
jgi:hypothetical protein